MFFKLETLYFVGIVYTCAYMPLEIEVMSQSFALNKVTSTVITIHLLIQYTQLHTATVYSGKKMCMICIRIRAFHSNIIHPF